MPLHACDAAERAPQREGKSTWRAVRSWTGSANSSRSSRPKWRCSRIEWGISSIAGGPQAVPRVAALGLDDRGLQRRDVPDELIHMRAVAGPGHHRIVVLVLAEDDLALAVSSTS